MTAARSAFASGGSATTARCRQATGGAGSPPASPGTPRGACPSGCTCGAWSPAADPASEVPDRRAVAIEYPPAQPVPLRDPGVPVVRALDRPDDDVADVVAAQQRPRAVRVPLDVHG